MQSDEDDSSFRKYVDYNVDGVNYHTYLYTENPPTISFDFISYTKTNDGKNMILYYNAYNPNKVVIPSESILPIIISWIGFIRNHRIYYDKYSFNNSKS